MSCREVPNAAVWYCPLDVGLTCNWRKVTAQFVSVCLSVIVHCAWHCCPFGLK